VDTPEMQFLFCQTSAADAGSDLVKVVDVWTRCLAEQERRGNHDILPDIRGELAIAQANLAVSHVELSPAQRHEHVLVYLAAQQEARFTLETLAKYYRAFLDTDQGRSRMEDFRDLSFRLQVPDLNEGRALDGIFRRYLEDAGMRWAGYGTQAGAEPDVVVRGRVKVEEEVFLEEGVRKMQRVTTIIEVQDIEFRRRVVTVPGFSAKAVREAREAHEAREASIKEAARMCAAATLHRLIQKVFEAPDFEQEPRELLDDDPAPRRRP
jgi:hypothetical protein